MEIYSSLSPLLANSQDSTFEHFLELKKEEISFSMNTVVYIAKVIGTNQVVMD